MLFYDHFFPFRLKKFLKKSEPIKIGGLLHGGFYYVIIENVSETIQNCDLYFHLCLDKMFDGLYIINSLQSVQIIL